MLPLLLDDDLLENARHGVGHVTPTQCGRPIFGDEQLKTSTYRRKQLIRIHQTAILDFTYYCIIVNFVGKKNRTASSI